MRSRWIAFVAFVCCVLVSMVGCAAKKTIINGLDEREANEIMVFLASKDIQAYKIKAVSEGPGGGKTALWDIAVDSDRATEAMSILNANGLPRRRSQHLLELFTSGGLVPSEMQEKIKYQAGLAEQIASTIRKIDGILDAEVQLSIPEEDVLNPKAQKGEVTASVFVKHQGVLDDPNSQLIPKIRRLVTSAVQGLKYENVTVIADRARFSDAAHLQAKSVPGETEMVRIWTVAIAKESVGRFQTLFVTLISLVALFLLLSFWLLWKVFPVARECGGVRSLFSLHPLTLLHGGEELPEGAKQAEKGLPEGQKGPNVQENIEST